MKKTGILIVVCAILFTATGFAQNTYVPWLEKQSLRINSFQLKTGIVGSYPRHTEEFNWTTSWVLFQTIETSYNSVGNPTVVEYNQGGQRTRTVYSYNDQHAATEVINQTYVGSAWVTSSGMQMTYALTGSRVDVVTMKEWNAATSTWVNTMRETYSYSGSDMHFGSVTMDQWNNAWVPFMKTDYSWSNNLMGQTISYMYDNGTWTPTTKSVYEWKDYGSFVMVNYTYLGPDDWMAFTRTTTTNDSHGNAILIQSEMNLFTSWSIVSASRYQLTYSGNNLAQRITETNTGGQWSNTRKEIFSNWISLSTDITLLPEARLSVFPNPAGKQAIVRIAQQNSGSITLSVFSMTGQKIIEESFKVQSTDINYQLNLEKVPTGSYLLIATDKQGAEIGKARLIKN